MCDRSNFSAMVYLANKYPDRYRIKHRGESFEFQEVYLDLDGNAHWGPISMNKCFPKQYEKAHEIYLDK